MDKKRRVAKKRFQCDALRGTENVKRCKSCANMRQ